MSDILKKLKNITTIQMEDLAELFCQEEKEILDKGKVLTLAPDQRFILVDEEIEFVWILLSGHVKGLEELYTGDIFAFNKFYAPEIFGEMEILSGIDCFKATLTTETACVFLLLPTGDYKEFLENNSKFLYKRTRIIMKRYFEDQKRLRTFLMIKAIDRIKIYLCSQYKYNCKGGRCTLRIPRQQIAEEIGYAVKTVNRTMKELENQDFLCIEGQKIMIDQEQYEKMRKTIENLVD